MPKKPWSLLVKFQLQSCDVLEILGHSATPKMHFSLLMTKDMSLSLWIRSLRCLMWSSSYWLAMMTERAAREEAERLDVCPDFPSEGGQSHH